MAKKTNVIVKELFRKENEKFTRIQGWPPSIGTPWAPFYQNAFPALHTPLPQRSSPEPFFRNWAFKSLLKFKNPIGFC